MIENPTHQVTVLVQSQLESPEVHMEIKWQPLISDEEIEEMGYVPAAYKFIQSLLEMSELLSRGDVECELSDLSDRTLN